MTQKITLTISRDPSKGTKIAVEGHAGPGCKTLTAAIEASLGSTTQTQTTDEFNQAEVQQKQQQIQRG